MKLFLEFRRDGSTQYVLVNREGKVVLAFDVDRLGQRTPMTMIVTRLETQLVQ